MIGWIRWPGSKNWIEPGRQLCLDGGNKLLALADSFLQQFLLKRIIHNAWLQDYVRQITQTVNITSIAHWLLQCWETEWWAAYNFSSRSMKQRESSYSNREVGMPDTLFWHALSILLIRTYIIYLFYKHFLTINYVLGTRICIGARLPWFSPFMEFAD